MTNILRRVGGLVLAGLMALAGTAAAISAPPAFSGAVEVVEAAPQSTNPDDYPVPVTEAPFGLAQSERVDEGFFDDAVFVGDSISLKLMRYVMAQRKERADFLGEAQFLTSGSLGSANALWEVSSESVHPSYRGTKMLLEDAIAKMGARKVYIMLGMNDVALYGIQSSVENMGKLLRRIQEKSPGVTIYVQSATPRIARVTNKPTNRQIFDYNLALARFCEENGYPFVDVAYAFRDQAGNLPDEYCSDAQIMGMHFTDAACLAWIEFLATHTG